MDVAWLFSIGRLNVLFTVTGANLQNFGIFYFKFLIRFIKHILPSSYGKYCQLKTFKARQMEPILKMIIFFFYCKSDLDAIEFL